MDSYKLQSFVCWFFLSFYFSPTLSFTGKIGVSTPFYYTGNIVSYTVPPYTTLLTIQAVGAGGGENFGLIGNAEIGEVYAGRGASTVGDFPVTPGQVCAFLK